jgi:hypothetical protein
MDWTVERLHAILRSDIIRPQIGKYRLAHAALRIACLRAMSGVCWKLFDEHADQDIRACKYFPYPCSWFKLHIRGSINSHKTLQADTCRHMAKTHFCQTSMIEFGDVSIREQLIILAVVHQVSG